MTDPLAQISEYLTALTEQGIRAVDDPRDINPPCVLIRPPLLNFRFGRGCVGADWTARLILNNAGTRQAIQQAIPLIEQIQTALSGQIVTAVPVEYELSDGGGPIPGYELTWTTH